MPPALGRHVHGPVRTRPLASPFDAQSFSRRAGSDRSRVPAHPVSQRWAFSSSGDGRAVRRSVRSARESLPCLRCGWHTRGSPRKPPCRRRRTGQFHSGACAPCAHPATPDASEGKWCGAAPPFCRLIRISFSARLETPAMGNIEGNCVGQSRAFTAIFRLITIPRSVRSCAWTDNMAQEPSWPTWPDCRL